MGTASEWLQVLIKGGLWGALMMLSTVFKPRAGGKDPALYLNLLFLAIGAFFYGLALVFGFRALRWPLVTITLPALAAFVLAIELKAAF